MIGHRAPSLRTMSLIMAAVSSMGTAPLAMAQDDDGWDMVDRPGERSLMAYAEYDSGVAIAVRCNRRAFNVVLTGLPALDAKNRAIVSRMQDLPEVRQTWLGTENPNTFISTYPARYAIALSRGGELKLGVAETFDGPQTHYSLTLPSNGEGVKRVMAACNISPASYPAPDEVWNTTMPTSWSWTRHVKPQYPSPTSVTQGEATLLCRIKANGQLHQCLIENESPAGAGFGQAVLNATSLGRISASDPAYPLVDGSWVSFTTRFRLD